MPQKKAVTARQLRSLCDLAEFNFTTTDELKGFTGFLGQARAIESLSLGLEINKPGYNLYLMGSSGLGKQSLLKQSLASALKEKSPAADWCYVANFANPQKPKVILLPSGQASIFRAELRQFIEEFKNFLPRHDSLKNRGLPQGYESGQNQDPSSTEQVKLTQLLAPLTEKYRDSENVINYLNDIEKKLTNDLNIFFNSSYIPAQDEDSIRFLQLENYDLNVVTQTSENQVPVIYEDNPTLQNLFGQIEYTSQGSALITNYRTIKSGALHHANGGYLVIDADKLLEQPLTWETLKRALAKQEIEIPTTDNAVGNASLVSLQPEVIPLDVKVILVGSRELYNKLVDNDEAFSELFKVEVDFSDSIDVTKQSLNDYAQVIATLLRKNNLLALDQDAVKCVIEYGMRQLEETTQLSTHMHSIQELLIEADYWAKKQNQKIVSRKDVLHASDKQIYRAARNRDRIYDEIKKGTINIDVSGEKVATVNGLFIIETGRIEFAQPARITANVRIGDGDIIDIEREVDLGGSIHSKGVLILSSYLGAHYATNKPLALNASLVFEQSYGSVDGDSATVGELCALLSAISKIPVKQSLAITGSADQHGNVQAIGGINDKIEGFFDICKQNGFTGEQGVIFPASNIPHLILRDDVIDAIAEKQFVLYPVNTVDEAVSLLTGLPAGKRNAKGEFPKGSVNFEVEKSLLKMAEIKHDDQQKDEHDEEDKDSKKDKREFNMIIQNTIEKKLADAFSPLHLEVINESSNHNVPEGSESHFKVVVVSPDFAEKNLLARHRLINAALADELKDSIHALAIHTYTEDEWKETSGGAPMSPPCLG